ncbi:protein phosphatase 1 regulatory subunit 3B isoform X2 [Anopheles stephensi]|uniref:CBM21 domain-containing protein n=1 Tax=Anopheles stephensi TaxID=30069 RepID=A0A182YAH8_ANOST|nr:protein phosphatase 1 regulatory subunit 3B isoform X2 [Anopheles stephensi]XP_035897631.1 protein phosphatase 1 regulatory subunit 3B isoform X2 [Anopheles stephensi]
MPAFAEMLVSQSPPVYNHSLSTDYKPGGGSPGSGGGSEGGGVGGGYYCRPASLQLSQAPTNGGPPPFQRQFTPPCLSPTGAGGKLPMSPRRSCLVIRPDHSATTPEESEPPHAAMKMLAVTEDETVSAISTGRSKKKVVFADDHGKQLTQVRVMREPSYMPPIWSLQFLAHVTQGMISPVPQEQWVVDFVQPASDYVRFRQKLDERNVSLENVIIKETEQLIVGTVKVKNLSYHKEVIIRSSCDSWKTHEDTFCTYSVVGNGTASAYLIFDTFSFKLTLPPKSRRIEFCAAFKCDGIEYWDNNDGRNYSLTNRIAPRENSGAFLSSSSASAFNSANPGRNGMAVTGDSFSSPYVDPGAVLDTWSDMSVESQSGPYCTFDCSLNTCSNNRVPTAHPQMKPISLNLSYPDGRSDVSECPTAGGERRASTGEFAAKKSCNHPAGTKAPISTLGRSASSGKLFYIRERHEGEDLLANLLRLRKLMMGAISNDVVTK